MNQDEEVNEYDDEFGPEDFGFVIGPDGELKSMTIPENLMEDPPKTVRKIMKIFGICILFVLRVFKRLHTQKISNSPSEFFFTM